MVTYREVFIDKIYTIQDFDLMWQSVTAEMVTEAWSAVEMERRQKKK